MANEPYSGVENLEIMQEAENYNRYLLNTVLRHAPAGARVLDFGAGNGEFAVPLSAQGFNLVAVEPDDFLRRGLGERGVTAASSTSGLANASFDYVYTLNVLEHIEDHEAALRQLHDKLKPGGRLLIYVPAFPILYSSMDARVGHIRRYTRRGLVAIVKAAGFDVATVAYVDSLGFLATLVFKWLGSKDGGVNRTALKAYDRAVFPLSRLLDFITRRWFGKNLLLLATR